MNCSILIVAVPFFWTRIAALTPLNSELSVFVASPDFVTLPVIVAFPPLFTNTALSSDFVELALLTVLVDVTVVEPEAFVVFLWAKCPFSIFTR